MTIVTYLLAAGAIPAATFRNTLTIAVIMVPVLMVLYGVMAIARKGRASERPRWNVWESLVYCGAAASVAVLSLTAFGSIFRFGALEGWPLLVHMLGAGAFTAALPLLAVTWCHAHRCSAGCASDESRSTRFFWLPQLTFWLILASGLVTTMTMLLSMLPIFGTDGLQRLLEVHRYGGLVVATAFALHVFGVVLQWSGLR